MDAIDQRYVEQLRRDYAAGLNELWAENTDFPARLGTMKVSARYDPEDDLLEITLGGPQEALSYSIHNTLFLRADFESLKIVGVELEHFRRHIAGNSIEFRFCWAVLQLAGTAQLTIRSSADRPTTAFETIVRELVATP